MAHRHPLTFLITGCSSGLGLTLSRTALANGHNLIATSRNPSRTPNIVTKIEGAGGRWLELDVDDRVASTSFVDKLEKQGTQIDILVNNAGSSIRRLLRRRQRTS
jgi:NADP-dependent 3-hydroxy acid dehydrogenase YdfG